MAKNKMQEAIDEAGETAAILDGEAPEGFREIVFKPALAKAGESIVGVYQGEGSVTQIKGKDVKNYKIEDDAGTVHLIRGTAQLIQFFDTVKVGTRVWLKRGAQVEGGKGRVNTYRFAVVAATGE